MNELLPSNLMDTPFRQFQELLPNAFTVDGVAVHVLRTETGPGEMPDAPAEAPAFAFPAQKQEMHYAIVEGYILNATSLGRMAALIQAVQAGEAVENSLAAKVDISPESLFEFRIDLPRYFVGPLTALLQPEVANAIRELQAQNLTPLRGTISARGGEAATRLAIPVDTVAATVQALSKLQGSEDPSLPPGAPSQP
jgi:hypothetical protein